jgi:hypothetical protein
MTEDGYKHDDHCIPPPVQNISSIEEIGLSRDISGVMYLISAHLTAQLHMNMESLGQRTMDQDQIPYIEHFTLSHGIGSNDSEMDLHVHDEVLHS